MVILLACLGAILLLYGIGFTAAAIITTSDKMQKHSIAILCFIAGALFFVAARLP